MEKRLPESFSPIVKNWFASRYQGPTEIQLASWPRILAGEHVLVSAPTGSGKTLTAFLCGINALITGEWPTDRVSLLYISPLKALNNDIERNLLAPLEQMEAKARAAGHEWPSIRVATRSGDTPSAKRQSMVRRPPSILITTPESLNLILSSPRAREMLRHVRALILDEIHAVLGEKRGTHLITAVERVALLAGEVQRIALSATVRPMNEIAAFVGGVGRNGPRPVALVESGDTKEIEFHVRFPDTSEPEADPGFWPHLQRELLRIIEQNQSTLIFVNTRRHAEKLTLLLNADRSTPIAYSHHGSLSRELREFVEQALKNGELRAIVATNSLELGIDIGALDQVILVGTPPEIRSTLQRVGRAGHQVGATSRAVLFPLHGRDLIDAVAMGVSVAAREIESVAPVRGALDVLAQVIVSMTAVEEWQVDLLYAAVRSAAPYAQLPREHFDLVLEMLAGRYQETRIAELKPRVRFDRVRGTVQAREEARLLLYASGGTIPDRGYFQMRSADGSRIGELDEEFVWERRVGESFMLGSQVWTIEQITEKDVVVHPAKPGSQLIPFWRAFSRGRHPFYADRVLELLSRCERAASEGDLEALASDFAFLDDESRSSFCEVIARQRAHTGRPLPHGRHVLLESILHVPPEGGAGQERLLVVHTLRGLSVNLPLALSLEAHFRSVGETVEVHASNDSLAIQAHTPMSVEALFSRLICQALSKRGALDNLLRMGLESSSLFGALFRENAGRALLLPKAGFGKRMPLWLNRRRSKRIIDAVSGLAEFPIMIETWRSCLEDHFDLDATRSFLAGVADGEIRLSTCTTDTPSPFAQDVMWQHTNVAMYESEAHDAASAGETSAELVNRIVHNSDLRPSIPRHVVTHARLSLSQTAPGYAPATGEDIVDWVEERAVVTLSQLGELREAVIRDHGQAAWQVEGSAHQLLWISHHNAVLLASANRRPLWEPVYCEGLVAAVADGAEWDRPPPRHRANEGAGSWRACRPETPESHVAQTGEAAERFLLEILRRRTPLSPEQIEVDYGVSAASSSEAIERLEHQSLIVLGTLVEGETRTLVCHADVLEYLLRLRRNASRPSFKPIAAERLALHWASTTHLLSRQDDPGNLVSVLDTLFAYSARSELWETDYFTARMPSYLPSWLDGLLASSELIWFGSGKARTGFALRSDLELTDRLGFEAPESQEAQKIVDSLRADGPADTLELRDRIGMEADATVLALWQAVWAGQISNTSYEALRAGIKSGFSPSRLGDSAGDRPSQRWPGRRRSGRLPGRAEWAATHAWTGSWYALPLPAREQHDPLATLERDKEWARLLLDRYGVVARDVVAREELTGPWRRLFRALRLMELSGEVVSGLFVHDLCSPQFAQLETLDLLGDPRSDSKPYWMNATDPASPAGVLTGAFDGALPQRLPGTHLVFRGTQLIGISRRFGKELEFFLPPDDRDAASVLLPLRAMVSRQVQPRARVSVERVNGVEVRASEYAGLLRDQGFRDEYKSFVLAASYR